MVDNEIKGKETETVYKRTGSKRKMFLKMLLSSLIRRKSRMLVALLAVAIGGTILSGLMTIYYDIPRQMGKEFRTYGANMIFLPNSEDHLLSTEDVEIIRSDFTEEELEGIAPFSHQMAKANEQSVVIAGTDFAEVKKTRPYWYLKGSWAENENEIMVGSEIADVLRLVPGKHLTIDYKTDKENYSPYEFEVVGIIDSGKSEDGMIFIDIEKMKVMTAEDDIIDVIELSVALAKEKLDEEVLKYDGHNRLNARLVKKVADSENTVLSKLQALVWLVSIIVLILTMISVGTTMMAAVMERREEIGLKKALGALDRSIIREFIFEGLFLGAFGGAFGTVLGFTFAQTVSMKVFGRGIYMQPVIAVVTIIISVVITGIASLIPLRRTTEIDPAVVLKGE